MSDFFCHSWPKIIPLHRFLPFSFSIKWFFHKNMDFNLFFHVFVIILCDVFFCRRLVRLVIYVVLVQHIGFCHFVMMLYCV